MAQIGILLWQKWDGVLIGLFLNDALAKDVADKGTDGEYLLVPAEVNQAHADLFDENLPGAIIYRSQGVLARIVSVEGGLANTDALLDTTRTQATTKFAQVDSRLDGNDSALTDLDTRVTALENP